ncbi:MAG: hypothetical protein JSS98_04295 [Bacteroidetes bacterium]|nr:hypothetical protein [Bacteroidota bacterium]
MIKFEDFLETFGERYDYHFVYSFPTDEIKKKVLENIDNQCEHAKEQYLNDLKLKEKRMKILYDIYDDCFRYNIFLCSKLCELEYDIDTTIKYEHSLGEIQQNIRNNISLFVIESSNDKIVAMKYAIKILEETFEISGHVFITIDKLMKLLLFKPHLV